MKTAPKLTPELDVADLDRSLNFYLEVLGFQLRFSRPEERFAYLTLDGDGLHFMLKEPGAGRQYSDAPLEYPYGRGVNFQIEVQDVDVLYARVLTSGLPVPIPLEERWYRENVVENGNRQFVVADPDGYLLRFFTDLGERPTVYQPLAEAHAGFADLSPDEVGDLGDEAVAATRRESL